MNAQVTGDNPWAINAHQLSATQSFRITVNPLTPVTLQPLGYNNGSFLCAVAGQRFAEHPSVLRKVVGELEPIHNAPQAANVRSKAAAAEGGCAGGNGELV